MRISVVVDDMVGTSRVLVKQRMKAKHFGPSFTAVKEGRE